jgi:hypothetical protein
MLREREYRGLVRAIELAGGAAFTSPEEYLAAHHLPRWYPLVRDFTPETRIFPAEVDLVRELQALGWDAFFVKDYVKSLKTSAGSLIRDPKQITQVVADMRKYRGDIEGGLCIRRLEDLLPETERRYFVIDSLAYAAEASQDIPEVVQVCARRILSRFFSVDVASRADATLRIVEIGDGQVSDLVGWSPERFAEIWVAAMASARME